MKVVKHTAMHIFVHIALFTALALLIPVVSSWMKKDGSWVGNAAVLTASVLLIIVCVVLVYMMKESATEVLKTIGSMMFLPGALAVIFSVSSADTIVLHMDNSTTLSLIAPVANFYIHHSVPAVLSVASVYMLIGGSLFWIGTMLKDTKQKVWNK